MANIFADLKERMGQFGKLEISKKQAELRRQQAETLLREEPPKQSTFQISGNLFQDIQQTLIKPIVKPEPSSLPSISSQRREEAQKRMEERFRPRVEKTIEGLTGLGKATSQALIEPGTLFAKPALEKLGVDPRIALGIGLGIDIFAPIPGAGKVKKTKEVIDFLAKGLTKETDIAASKALIRRTAPRITEEEAEIIARRTTPLKEESAVRKELEAFREAKIEPRVTKEPLARPVAGRVPRVLPKAAPGEAIGILPREAEEIAKRFSTKLVKTREEITVGLKKLLVSRGFSERRAGVIAEDIAPKAKEVFETTKDVNAGLETISNKLRGLKPDFPLKEPKLVSEVTGGVAKQAIRFAKDNPQSSLVAKKLRNLRTKELEEGSKLFKRIGEGIRNNEIDIRELPQIAKRYKLSNEQVAQLFEDAASFSGRTLGSLSRVEKELRRLIPDIKLPERIPTLWERFKSGYLAVDNFRRGLLVTQLATAMRNAISQTGRYTIGTATDAMNGVISKITGKGPGFTPFLEDIAAVFRKFESGNVEKLRELLKRDPIEAGRLYNTPVGDIALSNKITNTLNALNRAQEYFFRNLVLDAKLNTAAKIKGVPVKELDINDLTKAVDEALEWTFSKNPIRGSFGDAIMRTYRAMPPLTLINPFPRFMSNAIKFIYDFSPGGLMTLFNPKTRAAIAAGDYTAISKAIIGTSMLGAALTVRSNDNLAGEKWYEIKVNNKRVDTRPFAPFSTYLFLAEFMIRGGERITGPDLAQATIGINRLAGTGLVLLDLFEGKLDAKSTKRKLDSVISAYIGGFTVPFVTIKDVVGNFRLEERTIKETREISLVGGAFGNVPILNEILPTKFSMFEDKPLTRENPLLRQLTGLSITTKPFIAQELDRMGKQIGDLVPKTGNLEANRIITKQIGVILDQFNEKLNLSDKYKNMSDEEKLEFLKSLISEAKKEAKGEVASDLAGVVYNELKKARPDERKKAVQTLRDRGLMTENILDYLLPMLEAQPLAR